MRKLTAWPDVRYCTRHLPGRNPQPEQTVSQNVKAVDFLLDQDSSVKTRHTNVTR